MGGGNYYCLIAGLPEISLDDKKLTLSVQDIRPYFKDYLSDKEMDIINLFFLPNDNAQILRILQKKEPDPELQTVFDAVQLIDEVNDPLFLPSYLKNYLLELRDEDHIESNRLPEIDISEKYWEYMISQKNKMIKKYSEYSVNIRNLITALNCRKFNFDIEKEVIGNTKFSFQLKTSQARDFELTDDYPFVEKVLTLFEKDNPAEREYAIDMLYWDFLDEETERKFFSFENIISYMLKLMILERWSKMTTEEGRKIFETLLSRFKTDFRFSKEFNL
ncbi:MAG: DUF2764 family protein [Bacilli bacterium]|nr:DUF2764 family protein [Bacilli bacterium]